jgi:hypothetical protein
LTCCRVVVHGISHAAHTTWPRATAAPATPIQVTWFGLGSQLSDQSTEPELDLVLCRRCVEAREEIGRDGKHAANSFFCRTRRCGGIYGGTPALASSGCQRPMVGGKFAMDGRSAGARGLRSGRIAAGGLSRNGRINC